MAYVSKSTAEVISKIERIISNTIDERGFGLTPAEIASTITSYAYLQCHTALLSTLDMSKEQRLELALSMKAESDVLNSDPKEPNV